MDSPDEEDQMRQMMGFSSFGANKKPKHNPKGAGASSTSTNLTPLGNRSISRKEPANKPSSGLPSRPPVVMGMYEQELNEERSQWVAARLPNPSPTNEDSASNGDALTTQTTPGNSTPSLSNQQPADLEITKSTNQLSTPSASFNVQAEPFHPTPASSSNHKHATTGSATNFSKNDVRSEPTYWSSIAEKNSHEDVIAYVSPWTGAELTRRDLREYGAGKQVVQANGEVVLTFFKPSFVEEGIWDRWEKKETNGR